MAGPLCETHLVFMFNAHLQKIHIALIKPNCIASKKGLSF